MLAMGNASDSLASYFAAPRQPSCTDKAYMLAESHLMLTAPAPYPRPFLLSALLDPGCGERLFNRRRSVGILLSKLASLVAALMTRTPAALEAGLGCSLRSCIPWQKPEQDACVACKHHVSALLSCWLVS